MSDQCGAKICVEIKIARVHRSIRSFRSENCYTFSGQFSWWQNARWVKESTQILSLPQYSSVPKWSLYLINCTTFLVTVYLGCQKTLWLRIWGVLYRLAKLPQKEASKLHNRKSFVSFFIYLFKKIPPRRARLMFLPHSTLAKRLLILHVCTYPTKCNQALLCPKSKKMPSNQFQSYRRVLKGEALWTNIYEFGRKLSSILPPPRRDWKPLDFLPPRVET